jgi:polyphosphate kinase
MIATYRHLPSERSSLASVSKFLYTFELPERCFHKHGERRMAKGKKTGTAPAAAAGEVRRNAIETARAEERWQVVGDGKPPRERQRKYRYVDELVRLQFELIKLQEWVRKEELRVVVVFEGRDAAGKGGAIKRISESLNPRFCRIVALSTPTERERGQWYFQRYVAQLPVPSFLTRF